MFRNMKRNKQELEGNEIENIMKDSTSGILALCGENDYPYSVPISYVYDENKIYFHCGKTGHKIDSIKRNPKASFCVIGQDIIRPEIFSTDYKSVIAFGKIHIVQDEKKKREAIENLCHKYCDTLPEEAITEHIEQGWNALCILEFDIEHISGKQSSRLAKEKNK